MPGLALTRKNFHPRSRFVTRLAATLATSFLLWPSGCAAPRYNPCTLEGKAAITDAVNLKLTREECADAIAQIETVYGSACTDNQVRMARAAAHGCAAQINFFKLLGDLADGGLVGKEFWKTMARLFPSTTLDTRVESTWYATDALMAALKPGTITAGANQINADTPNVGSVVASDRIDDANAYLIFLSMATIGGLQNRYSAPDASYNKTQVLGYSVTNATTQLGWANAANVGEEGCSYSSAILNLVDAINAVGPRFDSNLSEKLSLFVQTFEAVLNLACEAGCNGSSGSGCALAANACSTCPRTLRNRASCTGAMTDLNTCAAAGIAAFVNTAPEGWVP